MLHFIPAWYQENQWCENEQYWYARRMHTEFDDTVKQIQLFHRSQAYPFQVMLLSFAPNYRHFLHRQSVFHAPYWSVFDAIQEIRKKKVRIFSFHNLQWPKGVEFVYSPFVVLAFLHGEKYAQIEFGEDGNMIQIDLYENDMLKRRNIYDDRGFISATRIYENEVPVYQDYLNEKGIWKLRHYFADNHVEINPRIPTYLTRDKGVECQKEFAGRSYESMEEVICEVLVTYLRDLDEGDMFCVAMHKLHTGLLKKALKGKKTILSFYEKRYQIGKDRENADMIAEADYIIADSQENLKKIKKEMPMEIAHITDITPFDSRVDFGISQQLNVQKILVPVDGIKEERLEELIVTLGEYLPGNPNARVHLFTRIADFERKKNLLRQVQGILRRAGMNEDWASEKRGSTAGENRVDAQTEEPILFVVEQCVDELSVSKCMREQRLIVDMRSMTELYLRIMGISVGIPQIVYKSSPFVEHEKNGLVIKDMTRLPEAIRFYLDSLNHWNEAMVYSYELGKKYTTKVLIDKWKEVIDFVGADSHTTVGK